ncbi:M15 family metallopeptidase [Brachyspira pilosicoli]|uniref:M15 family metallopeptidase n=1 Tax=Brachyspira pilosicoli TaxID=52584 RepID=UPI0030055073
MAGFEYLLIIVAILFLLILLTFLIKKITKHISILFAVIIIMVLSVASLVGIYFNYTTNISANMESFSMEKQRAEEKKRLISSVSMKDGVLEILSLHLAYSNRISKPIIRNGEIGFYLDDIWFNWADGKLLTDEDISNADNYISFGFYSYPVNGLPVIQKATPERTLELQEYYKRRINNKKIINNTFLNTLYDGSSPKTMMRHIKTVSILGYRTSIHDYIVEPLSNASVEVKSMAQTNVQVKNYLASLKTVSGYVWKIISKSASRSYHSYGVAVDTLPKRSNGKQIYWAWTRVNNKEWYAVPFNDRWNPPKEVIKIFEKYGFIWGGKWHNYDTVHFEYRPELIIYNRIKEDEEELYRLIKEYGLY